MTIKNASSSNNNMFGRLLHHPPSWRVLSSFTGVSWINSRKKRFWSHVHCVRRCRLEQSYNCSRVCSHCPKPHVKSFMKRTIKEILIKNTQLTLWCWLPDFPVKIAFLVNHIVHGSKPERGNLRSKAFRSLSIDPGEGISTFTPSKNNKKEKRRMYMHIFSVKFYELKYLTNKCLYHKLVWMF